MRLIDADELVKLLKANTMSNGTLINTNTMIAVVEKMQTAYDVEKVVEEFEKESKWYIVTQDGLNFGEKAIRKDKAVDIVKRGVGNEILLR